jgi:hypothetical protein
MVGVIGMGLVIAELSLVLAALSKLSGLQGSIEEGGNFLQTVGTAIGQFVGGLVGGFAKGATKDLPEIATNLSGFADNIGGFLDIAPKLASSLAGLAGASIVDGISRIFNFGQSSMGKLKTELPKLGKGLEGFAKATENVDPDKVKNAAEAAQAVAEMTNHIPNSGGVVSWFTGDNSISQFSSELINLGLGLAGFALVTSGINGSKVKGAAEAAQAVADMTNHIPNSLAIWQAGFPARSVIQMSTAAAAGSEETAGATTGAADTQPKNWRKRSKKRSLKNRKDTILTIRMRTVQSTASCPRSADKNQWIEQ